MEEGFASALPRSFVTMRSVRFDLKKILISFLGRPSVNVKWIQKKCKIFTKNRAIVVKIE